MKQRVLNQQTSLFLVVLTMWACTNSAKQETLTVEKDVSAAKDTFDYFEKTNGYTEMSVESEEDTITVVNFQDLVVSISRLVPFEVYSDGSDTVQISTELGETIEGQKIKVTTSQLTDVTVEQRYETSITISDEGPHCDLTEWTHYYSEWKKLTFSNGEFVCDVYTEEDWNKFPPIRMDDLREKVKEQCGEGWSELISTTNSPTEYPSGVGISRYFLRITGRQKDTGQTVTRIIIILAPMGC